MVASIGGNYVKGLTCRLFFLNFSVIDMYRSRDCKSVYHNGYSVHFSGPESHQMYTAKTPLIANTYKLRVRTTCYLHKFLLRSFVDASLTTLLHTVLEVIDDLAAHSKGPTWVLCDQSCKAYTYFPLLQRSLYAESSGSGKEDSRVKKPCCIPFIDQKLITHDYREFWATPSAKTSS